MSEFTFDGLGTRWAIRTEVPLDGPLRTHVLDRVEAFDAAYSRFRPDSLVAELARRGGRVEFPADAPAMLDFYEILYRVTDGAVSPLVGRVMEHLGYDSEYSLRRHAGVAVAPSWTDHVRVTGACVEVERPQLLDFGAAGKGHLVDQLALLLLAAGIDDFLIDGSGDLRHSGPKSVRVGLEDPRDPTRAIGVANLTGRALCASAVNRRAWGDGLHHIVDPRTGEPTQSVLATWVMADTALQADGLATALFFTEPGRLAAHFDFGFVRMFASGAVDYAGFDGELFS